MKLRTLLLYALGTVLTLAADDEFNLRQLTEDNFKRETSRGIWLIEHFSPKCAHCRAFAPTWTQLAEEQQHLERMTGFHMAQVNCLAQGDLCNSNGIKFYPQLLLYADGKPLTPYSGDRSHTDLTNFIESQSLSYARGDYTQSTEENRLGSFSDVNPEGKVVEVDEVSLAALTADGRPVLVDYFAPWCGHCKKLKPIYENLASTLRGRLDIVSVDCDQHKTFCRKSKITGYPTIRLLHHGAANEYAGARSLEKMKAFAEKAIQTTTLKPITIEDWNSIVSNEDAFFLLLQTFDSDPSDIENVKTLLEPLSHSAPGFTSTDVRLYTNLSIAMPPPPSLLISFSSHSPHPIATLPFPTTQTLLERFILSHRFPTSTALTQANYQDIIKGDHKPIVVICAVHKDEGGEKARFESIARAWKRGGRDFGRPVWFVWVDGDKWSGWLKQSYGIKKKQLPAVVVTDPSVGEYYDTTIEGTKIAFDGASVFSVLEGVYQHFLRPKKTESTLEWGSRSAAMTLISMGGWSVDHPFIALAILISGVALFVYLLQKCVARDLRENGTRLD